MSYILASNEEMRHRSRFAYASAGFACAHILSHAELTLAYAHHTFSCLRHTLTRPFPNISQEFRNLERGSYAIAQPITVQNALEQSP